MRPNLKASLKTAVLAVTILLLGVGVSAAQQQINLTAGPSSATLPDGQVVPMWGYSCGAVVSGSTATCAKSNLAATGWSPVVITVPTGQGLTINLTNSLPGSVPTSLVIVGQLGGGLGTIKPGSAPANFTDPPDHSNAQTTTWPASDPLTLGTPPVQGKRVQSFSTQVAAGATTLLPAWTNLRPGTYLIESGTHPSIQGPMGLYGMLVVTTAPGVNPGVAYGSGATAVNYNADVPLLFSEIDPVQNNAVNTVVNTAGFSETRVWSGQPGKCGNPNSPVGTVNTCYPPAVNYTPLYYLFNGVAFDKTNASASLFPTSPATGLTAATGQVLVRLVNAGLRMHVPAIVGAQTGSASGFSLIAEDGNPLPGVTRVQSEVFMAAGKTYDVMVNVPTGGSALPVFDRQLSLSGNATARDTGMLAYISINGAVAPAAAAIAPAVARADTYNSVIAGQTLTVSDPAKGVIANDTNVYGVKVSGVAPAGLTLYANGTFTYTGSPTTFAYCGNGATSGAACTTVTLGAATIEAATGIVMSNITYTSNVATSLSIKNPGILSVDKDNAGYPLTVAFGANAPVPSTGLTLSVDKNGGFNASVPPHAGPAVYTFAYKAQNSQGTVSASTATVTLNFPAPSNLAVSVVDGKTKVALSPQDYRWIIEEDRTFYTNPNNTTNNGVAVASLGTNFHTSYMPVVAQGCTGPVTGAVSCETGQSLLGAPAACDVGNGGCRTGVSQKTAVPPSQVVLDPAKRYYISVLPGDAVDPGHAMGGAQIPAACTPVPPATTCTGTFAAVTVLVEPTPLPPAKVSVFVFQDDNPLNGEHDAGGGVDALSPNEPGLGQFNITLFDDAGGTGDATGQMTYDMFNMPLSNSLAGTKDPSNNNIDACPISKDALTGLNTDTGATGSPSPTGITGVIPVCPRYEADGVTLSPLAGQAVIVNLPPGRYGVVATPGADRIAKGEEWLQTNTLDGGKAHDSFIKVSEPSYFQEYGPAGYHVSIGFANPAIINGRKAAVCAGAGGCTNTVTGLVTGVHMSRTPDQRLYSSGSRDIYSFTQCYASLGDPDGADFAFEKCDDAGQFTFSGIPAGDWRVTIFDQWNDQIVDGISTPVRVNSATVNMGEVAVHQWKQNLYTRTFFDTNGDGKSQDTEPGLSLVPTNVRFRDGSFSNFNSTDLAGFAGFNEVFPLFSWYVVETDSIRYKNTGTHVVYDAGGPPDGTARCGQAGYPACGTSTIGQFLARTKEDNSLPANLRVPGSVYCDNADCTGFSIAGGPASSASTNLSTGRIDPPWVTSYGWQGFAGQNSFLEFGKKPFVAGENGGIKGHVVYASTRPFDDPALLLQLSWEPQVPNVTINLYQVGTAPDGSRSLKMVDTTQTSSFDDWAQGFRSDLVPNMNCPGQSTADLFYFTLLNQPNYLNPGTPLPNNSQFKCFDGMHNWVQLQPAPYDGMYAFPSIIGRNPQTGAPTGAGSVNGTAGTRPGSNCTICVANPTDGTPMLPAGKYVVEVVVPPNYELVKEEDKNILLGDSYIAPVTQQFAGLGAIYIMPDQAAVAATYNPNNPLNPTTDLGAQPRHEGDTGSVETFWPCVGQARIVPDYMSLFPGSGQNAPFAGATRNLCDRKEVTVDEQSSSLVKFYVFTSTHVAAHFTGIITDDFTSEFDPFSPQFGEKFSPAHLPVSIKDWAGNEVSRVYADQWGAYTGLNYSTYGVNPPAPTGYVPTMMVMCMNDSGNAAAPDPLFQSGYSQFCYELPFMPGQTGYFDTPVVPTSAFSEGYNHPDCAYPDTTPAISSVDGDGVTGQGPWVASGSGHTLTIHALGNQLVENYGYSGPSATAPPFNQKKITRHYGFGSTKGTVSIGGIAVSAANITTWNDSTIVVNVPTTVPLCALQQQAQYGGSNARCGELVVTAGNGKQSIDTVTVTIGGKPPTYVAAGQTIQSAIDTALPGDLIIVRPGTYNELLLMWKPVRLQGVGAASSIINATTHPAGNMDAWRRQVVCLFGLALNGRPITGSNPYDPTPVADGGFTCTGTSQSSDPLSMRFAVDRLPLEATVGWDATLNGNLAEQLQEPTLMGAYEGAAITVLSKGVNFHGGDPFASDTFPTGTTLLTATNCGPTAGPNPFPSNFQCNPSSIDALGITNSSQGGGGILVHAWGHNLQIANNRIQNNQGTGSGGITVGQGEHPDAYLAGAVNADPGSCQTSNVANTQLPYCFDLNVNIHHNSVTLNASEGDNLFSATPAMAGGVTFCTGADNYNFNYNWVCGNMSTGDGGGLAHLGFIYGGDIEHNSILFNQSTNPTLPTNGGGIMIMSAPDIDAICSTIPDKDCPPGPGLGDGTGPGLVINANLIMGNAAESGSGGGIRFQGVNGTEVSTFPIGPSNWYSVQVTNNIIANNVAGWDGAGVSLKDSLAVNFINNTVVSNDTTASSGVLFNTLFAPLASSDGCAPGQTPPCTINTSTPQPAGLVATPNSAGLTASFAGIPTITCPAGHSQGGVNNGSCKQISYPLLYNNVFWQNRSFHLTVGALNPQYQQNVVTLVPTLSQPQTDTVVANGGGVRVTGGTGACVTPPTGTYWDLGVRGDTGPTDHSSGFQLHPIYSVLTPGQGAGYGGGGTNTTANPDVASQYCNGSRIPPEFGGSGYQVPPGTFEGNAPVPIFSLTPAATVDEGNNWINMRWGPLSMTNPSTGSVLGSYGLTSGSSAIDTGISTPQSGVAPPSTDFFGRTRTGTYDMGAIEFGGFSLPTLSSIVPSIGPIGSAVPVTLTGTNLLGTLAVLVSGSGVTASAITVVNSTTVTAILNIPTTAAVGVDRAIQVVTPGGTSSPGVAFTIVAPVPTLSSISPTTGVRGTAVPVTLTGTGLFGATAISAGGAGVTASGITVNPAGTQITATFTITTGAGLTTRSVTVTTPGGTSAVNPAVTFTVLGATLTSISPTTGVRGTAVGVTITGANLTGASAVTVSGAGITVSAFTAVNSTTVTATFTIASGTTAPLTARNVQVVTPIGTTPVNPAVTFTVQGATLTSISPNPAPRGVNNQLITFTGTNLTGATGFTGLTGTGVTLVAGSITVVNSNTVTARINVTAAASTAVRNVGVTTPIGNTNTVAFTVGP